MVSVLCIIITIIMDGYGCGARDGGGGGQCEFHANLHGPIIIINDRVNHVGQTGKWMYCAYAIKLGPAAPAYRFTTVSPAKDELVSRRGRTFRWRDRRRVASIDESQTVEFRPRPVV